MLVDHRQDITISNWWCTSQYDQYSISRYYGALLIGPEYVAGNCFNIAGVVVCNHTGVLLCADNVLF